ncbi:N-acetylglucosaminyl-phosphatidylinositol biosynthetic protein isoform X1 [Acyrthosiphon pisum]|uniref:phosphatidylinositol N-acetylglucosaminyltransferase n=2 Tax=Acyrthosiphon pisum TaxID=7029 RepID=A0A8R2B7Y4_ACYPI|nr:N-acetylglucosaminyl-phosphatidylinositol biosynthetic protein isoform X1 [Acyrthosiphon pisum]|eukprot:XP_008185695.1 PREDICTED: N-acetylglucosaminyl-phosphatidylinositol biosynthetic protein isoform X1 [Acyrthosiphon pisum]
MSVHFKMKHKICMASDFFYPNMGGVEEHIFNLSQCLLMKGYKVIVLTHSYQDRVGVRYMTNGLKVYYLPIRPFYNQCVLPSMVSSLPLIRYVLVREQITIIHGHSAFSTLAHETMMIGRLLGIQTVFTDHSLFGFADTSAIITNKFLEMSLADCNHCICVSHIGKENTVLRARVNHHRVSVIPNAVDTTAFVPKLELRTKNKITIVVVSRLVYRKGVDLLAQIIADVCLKNQKVQFIIGGDGPKRELLEDIRNNLNIGEQVTLLGSLEHSQVCNVLNRGHIFLNTSLTEAYCMAIVEAASCGLKIVSTRVGGIPEVLPPELIILTEPNVPSILQGLYKAINQVNSELGVPPIECHQKVQSLYNWMNIAKRTEIVYNMVSLEPPKSLGKQLRSYIPTGVYPFLLVVSFMHILLRLLDWWIPRSDIDLAKDYKIEDSQVNSNSPVLEN